ncbi:MAG TPA: ArsA family ATPase [Solirubrobacteraceae bacterium]|nr:ArsA family ATPase [Solirubrobacteraceae bacterium]
MSALAKELLVVTGKGGVGKSTVAAAIGLIAARRGLRTIVAEVAARNDVTRAFEGRRQPGHYGEDELAPGLNHISIDPEDALTEYLHEQLPAPLAEVLANSRMFGVFMAATPGMRELLSIGKVWELAQQARRTPGAKPYDLVILDAPATGHGVAILEAPRTFAGAARVGTVARQGRTIHAMLADPARSGVIAVATPEEMPVNETIALRRALRERMGLDLERVVVNGVEHSRFSTAEAGRLSGDSEPVRAARWHHARARAHHNQLNRLRRGLDGVACMTLPQLHVLEVDAPELELLAGRLERAL